MPETGEQKRQRVAENLRRLKAANRPKEEIDQYLESEREVPSFTRDAGDLAGGLAQTAVDAATFGLAGLGEDAATALAGTGKYGDRFQLNRDLRKENKQAVAEILPEVPVGMIDSPITAKPATLARIGGTMLNPLGRLTKGPATNAGVLKTAANLGREGALQAGLQATGEHLGTSEDPTGLSHGTDAAILGGGMGLAIGAGMGLAPYASDIKGILGAKNAGDRAVSIDQAMERMDRRNYGKAEAEAVVTPPVRRLLRDDPLVKGVAEDVQADAAYQAAPMNDAQTTMAAYRRLSSNQRRAEAALKRAETGDVGYDPKLSEGTIANLKTAKGRILEAVEQPSEEGWAAIPSLRKAIVSKAKGEQARDAFETAVDMADRVALGKNVKGAKQLTQSAAAWKRDIGDYSPQEARRALQGLQGYVKEIPEFSANPLTTFNVVPSVVRTGLAVKRLRPFVAQLEQQMGKDAPSPSAILDYLMQVMSRGAGTTP